MPNRDTTNRIFIIVSVTVITKRYLLPSGYFSMVRNTIIIHTGIYLLHHYQQAGKVYHTYSSRHADPNAFRTFLS